MNNKNKGIALLKLLVIILIALLLGCILLNLFYTNVSQSVSVIYKSVTGQIDIDEEIKHNEVLMGITDVTGEGIVISVLDGKDLIHQEDLIILIDELKNSGSQAISINDIRVTNSTYLYCDGSVILMDGEKIGNPFTIKAIGNSETIYGAIMRNKGYLSTLNKDGIEISVEKRTDITILKTKKSELLNYSDGRNKISKLEESDRIIGKADVHGSGLEIVVHENSSKLTALSFLQIVNDLNSAGAKAILINGQRITNMTDMMDISSTYVLINSIPIAAPYTIYAIGDISKLEEAIDYNNSYINKIKSKGNNVEIYEVKNLLVDKYTQKKDKDKMAHDYLKYLINK